MGVGRIYSIQGEVVKRGEGMFSKFRGELAKRGGVKKFRGVWTLDEAMACRRFHLKVFSKFMPHKYTYSIQYTLINSNEHNHLNSVALIFANIHNIL